MAPSASAGTVSYCASAVMDSATDSASSSTTARNDRGQPSFATLQRQPVAIAPAPLLSGPSPTPPTDPTTTGTFAEPSPNDIICGRGKMTLSHPGNSYFRELILSKKEAYKRSRRRDDKTQITNELVQKIRDRGGRFIRLDPDTQLWYDVGNEYAREKISHSLRSRVPAGDNAAAIVAAASAPEAKPRSRRSAHSETKPPCKKRKSFTKRYQSVVQSKKLNVLANQIIQEQQLILKQLIVQATNVTSLLTPGRSHPPELFFVGKDTP